MVQRIQHFTGCLPRTHRARKLEQLPLHVWRTVAPRAEPLLSSAAFMCEKPILPSDYEQARRMG